MKPAEFLLADVLASSVHDVKNLLFDAESKLPAGDQPLDEARSLINSAGIRLTKMLNAYRVLRHDLKLPMTMVWVEDLVEDAILQFSAASPRVVKIEKETRYSGHWYLAQDEITDVLVNALQNASRFAQTLIRVVVTSENGQLMLEVHDDGPGFSDQMPLKVGSKGEHGLGLLIAEHIAAMHQRGSLSGKLVLHRSPTLGGALFQLVLP